jgi:hypothetical protein
MTLSLRGSGASFWRNLPAWRRPFRSALQGGRQATSHDGDLVHPYLTGASHRIKYLEMLYDHILAREGVVMWTGPRYSTGTINRSLEAHRKLRSLPMARTLALATPRVGLHCAQARTRGSKSHTMTSPPFGLRVAPM